MTLRVAARSLSRSPWFTAVVILILVLGIGAVSAMFSVVNAVLVKSLPGASTAELVRVQELIPNATGFARIRTYREWKKLTDIFQDLGGRQFCNPTLTGMGEPQQLRAPCVTVSWFRVHKVVPLIGRTFIEGEDEPRRAPVAMLSHAFWTERMGANPAVLGTTITLDKIPHTIVGVLPKGFEPFGKGNSAVFLPWIIATNELTSLEVTARLRPGVSIEKAQAAVDVVQARLEKDAPQDYKGIRANVVGLREAITGGSRDLLRLLLAASALVLLVACVNAASLFLARGASKQRETAIRGFLGANRWQLAVPALAEASLVSFAGGALGLLAAWGITRLLATRFPDLPRVDEIAVDLNVVFVALAALVLTILGCGLAPALFRWKLSRGLLVSVEVALTFTLLICSGLLIRTFAEMRKVDLGYNPSGVALGFVSQPEDPHDQREAAVALWRNVRLRLAETPDVESVATASATPAGGMSFTLPIVPEGANLEQATAADQPEASVAIVSGSYFHVAGLRLEAGRTFDDHDGPSAIISKSAAARYFNGHAIGQRIQVPQFGFNVTSAGAVTLREIVGVVDDVKTRSLADSGRMALYLPESQNAARFTNILVRAKSGDPMRLERAARRVLYEEAPALALAPMIPLDEANAYLTRDSQRAMWLLGAFAALALILACAGIHGVASYAASQRSREMGIRMALGARPDQLFALITKDALRLALAGAAAGLALAYASSRMLESLLFGIQRTDSLTYVSAFVILTAVALAASAAPALRAARTNPSITLRSE